MIVAHQGDSYIHPYGFAVFRTAVDLFQGWQIRVHIWLKRELHLPCDIRESLIHSHGWDLHSSVVVGSLSEVTFDVSFEASSSLQIFEVKSSYGVGESTLSATGERIDVKATSHLERHRSDPVYRIPATQFHSTVRHSRELAVSVVATQLNSGAPSYVVAPTGREIIQNRRIEITDADSIIRTADSRYRLETGNSDTWASFIFIQRADESVLMLKTIRNPRLWMPVGGRNDPEDIDPADTALRELTEEVSVRASAKSLEHLEVTNRDVGTGNIHFWRLKVENIESLTIPRDEIADAQWFSLNELDRIELFPATRRALLKLRHN
ncbi:NUDIX hydrolase [Nocardia fusca]|uniref:NUDIX hydrolase n=1 Tax=Nocardia fusca TaxID=941183 RepID=UPI0009FD6DA2|nr:NUDIX hydrolase [Nocardia fusca]